MNYYPDFFQHRYKVLNQLGQNFAGGRITYKGINIKSQQLVVIKQFQFAQSGGDWSTYRDIEQEIKVLKALDHPNIPYYVDSFETDTGFCLVQEYKQAVSLSESRTLTMVEIEKIAISILEILIYLQQQNPPIIHRDIKPENILIDLAEDIENIKVYLVDFGFARITSQDLAYSSVIKGTLGFMSPEQMFSRQLTEASDLYSLGVTLICLIADVNSTEINKLFDENYRFNLICIKDKASQKLLVWLEKMIKPKLSDRYRNAKDALKSLETAAIYSNKFKINYNFYHTLFEKQINSYAIFIAFIISSILAFWIIPFYKNSNSLKYSQPNVNYRYSELNYIHEQGLFMTEMEKYEEAIELFDRAISLNPQYEVSWYHKGETLRTLERYEESLATFKELQKISPNWSYSWLGEAVTLSFMNREEEGLIAIQKALKIDSNDSNLWTNKGFILMKLKRYKEAKISFEKALKIEPNNPYAKRKLLKIKKN